MLLALRRFTTVATSSNAGGATDTLPGHRAAGLTLRPGVEYPDVVRQVLTLIEESPT